MSTTENLYETLGIDKKATPDEIKKAYRKLAKKNHPDVGGDPEIFKKISHSYEILSDPTKKENYDKFGSEQPQAQPFSYADHFRNPFAQAQPERTGDNISLSLKLTLKEIFEGIKKTYKYTRNVKCGDCSGHGGTNLSNCHHCNGVGYTFIHIPTPIGHIRQTVECSACNGVGTTYTTKCGTCNGRGLESKEEIVDITIPHGVQEGITFVMGGKGHGIKSGGYGNLHINIYELPDKVYVRNGVDLRMKLNLEYTQLILGDKVDIDTIDGSKIRITIPEHTDVGVDLRIKNKGLKHFGNENRGDIIINLGINIPKTITEETKKILLELKNSLE